MEVYTIGHSTRGQAELLAALEAHGVRELWDVRAFPRSRRHPWFDREALEPAVVARGMRYGSWGRELGGHRVPSEGSPHVALREEALRGYAEHTQSPAFRRAVDALLATAHDARVALMCAERDWRRCHRRVLADHLVLVRAARVVHVLDDRSHEPHEPHPGARVADGRLLYDRAEGAPGQLDLFGEPGEPV